MLPPLCIVGVAVAAYANSFAGAFVLDDVGRILSDPRIRTLSPLSEVLSHRRPVVDYSLAVNYAIGADNPWGYHAFNLAVHILAALTLFGIVRRTLLSPRLRDRFGSAAPWLAMTVALLWVVHPLQTQGVTYLIQRAESMMGLFYLLTLYGFIRSVDATRPARWYAVAIVACALGMGCKAVMITAPVMVLLYDRCFLSRTWTDALRRRWVLYAGLFATMLILWQTGVVRGVLNPSARHAHVGFGFKGIGPIEYALTQCGVLFRYLHLSLWPRPLCLDYGWPVAETFGAIVPPALGIVALLSATLWSLRYRRGVGFAGAWFFLVLLPTSSFIPIKDPMFEHRMYLSLAAVIALVVLGGYELTRRLEPPSSASRGHYFGAKTLFITTMILMFGFLGLGTIRRNEVYRRESDIWRDVRTKRPANGRAVENHGTALKNEGRFAEAVPVMREAVAVRPRSANAHNVLGHALAETGRRAEALESFREAVRLNPRLVTALANLGHSLVEHRRMAEAIPYLKAAANLDSKRQRTLAQRIAGIGVRRLEGIQASVRLDLGIALLGEGEFDEAIRVLERSVELNVGSPDALNRLGIAYAQQLRWEDAIEAFQGALLIQHDYVGAHSNMGRCLAAMNNLDGAIRHYVVAVQMQPDNPAYHFSLGIVLSRKGEYSTAIETFETVLGLAPNHRGAADALDRARQLLGDPKE